MKRPTLCAVLLGGLCWSVGLGATPASVASPTRHIVLKDWTPQRCTPPGPGGTYLCLQGGRFRVDLAWSLDGRNHVVATAVALNANSGTFWFFSSDNSEVLVKVLDGCAVNHHWWVFFAATTNVAYSLQVSDLQVGAAVIWGNYPGQVARPVQDTSAFPCD